MGWRLRSEKPEGSQGGSGTPPDGLSVSALPCPDRHAFNARDERSAAPLQITDPAMDRGPGNGEPAFAPIRPEALKRAGNPEAGFQAAGVGREESSD